MNRIATSAQLAIAFLLAVTLFNPAASAQALAAGKISLPYQVEWLGRTVPAGQYVFSVQDGVPRGFLVLRSVGNRSGIVLMFEPGVSYDYSSENSVLNIVTVDRRRYVKSLGLAPLRRKFIYQTPKHKVHESLGKIASAQSIRVQ